MDVRDEKNKEPVDSGKEDEKKAEEKLSLPQLVQQMTVTQKAQFAMKGNKEVRMFLIRDANKVVQMGVINNEQISDSEVITIANSRNVDEEVLRRIAGRREWMKVHEIRASLVKNPKTPITISMKLIPTLLPQELKHIAKSKSVPTAVAQAARRRLLSKE